MRLLPKSESQTVFQTLEHKTATLTGIPVTVVEQVIHHQWKSVATALKTCRTVELSGVGYLLCSDKKLTRALQRAHRMMAGYLCQLQSLSPRRPTTSLEGRIRSCQALIDRYQTRLTHDKARLERAPAGNV